MNSQLKRNFVLSTILMVINLAGAIGTILPYTESLILSLTPINLLLSAILLISVHEGELKSLYGFVVFSYSLGFLIEVLGVHTGFPFGSYHYGVTLGWKAYEVPVIIGINWFLLSYALGALSAKLRIPTWTKWCIASLAMTWLDVLIEPVAVHLNYWTWTNGNIPIGNYIAWFFISFVMQIAFTRLLSRSRNPISSTLLLSQVLYFLILFIFIKF